MNDADGSASEVLEVNFFDGIILPRATPAWSGVMHSMSSMPRHSSQAATSFQCLTPRWVLTKAGRRARLRGSRVGHPFYRAASITSNCCRSATIPRLFGDA